MTIKLLKKNKNKFAAILLLLSACSCSPNIIFRTSFYTIADKKPTRINEYNIKSKKLTKVENQIKTVTIFKLKDSDKKFIKKSLQNVGINKSFCWVSDSSPTQYYYKYEIILDDNSISENCVSKPIKNEIFVTFHSIGDTIKKRVNKFK